jgi:PAS domain S-box-containing protein
MRLTHEKISFGAFLTVVAIGLIALIGWLSSELSLAGLMNKFIPMAPATSVCFILLAIVSIYRLFDNRNPIFSKIILYGILLFVSVILFDSITGYTIGIEKRLGLSKGFINNLPIGLMSPVTSALFLVSIVSLLLITHKHAHARRLSISLSTVGLFVAFIFDLGYLYGTPLLYVNSFIPPAWNTCFAFCILFFGILFGFGMNEMPLKLFNGESVRARLMRGFLPVTLLIIIISGWIDTIIMRVYNDHVLVSAAVTLVSLNVLGIILLKMSKKIGNDIDNIFESRDRSEEALRASEMKYRNLIEILPDAVYRSTHEGKFVDVNPAMVKILGYESREELMSINIKTQLYFDNEDRERLILETNAEKLGIFSLKKKDGSLVWMEGHGWHIKDEEGRILFHEGVLRDVTERKLDEIQLQKYSDELEELNATKDKFFSIIAHDLKGPFNGIVGFSEILKDEARQLHIETIQEYAGLIYTTSKNTYHLLEDLLDWARIQQSHMPFQPDTIFLQKIVNEEIELMVQKATSKMISVINRIPENLIISADEYMMKTVLRNLISNAIKFTSSNGTVEIKSEIRQDELEISVKDSGVGIRKEIIEKIFKIDCNYTSRGTDNETGTGLGLILCKEFVEKHGGRIWVESEEGKGSEFKLTIPLLV